MGKKSSFWQSLLQALHQSYHNCYIQKGVAFARLLAKCRSAGISDSSHLSRSCWPLLHNMLTTVMQTLHRKLSERLKLSRTQHGLVTSYGYLPLLEEILWVKPSRDDFIIGLLEHGQYGGRVAHDLLTL